MLNRVHFGDCRGSLRAMAAAGVKVQVCVTSPPYFGLRDYGAAGQVGLEETPDQYIAELVEVFRCVREVLADDGTLWLNLGDTYNNRRRLRSSSHQPSLNSFSEQSWAEAAAAGKVRMTITSGGLKEKDAFGIPWGVATALRNDGWFLRQEIIWRKTFGKPEPTKDRLPCRHEPIFLLSKSKRYFFDRSSLPNWAKDSIWTVPPTGHSEHGAAFPSAIVEPCILAGSRPGDVVLDPFMGSGTTAAVAIEHGRQFIGCELNTDYGPLQDERIEGAIAARKAVTAQSPLFAEEST